MSRIFFIADLHLGHQNIISYCNRPFESVEQMNEGLIRKWNQEVGQSDTVFFLGDFGFGSNEQIVEWGRRLKGNKTIILGNHDTKSPDVYHEAGFKFISKHPILWNERYILSHEPLNLEEDNPYFNIHGHIHNNSVYNSNKNFCVSVECINYKPIRYELIHNNL